jgi:hypothetical protein
LATYFDRNRAVPRRKGCRSNGSGAWLRHAIPTAAAGRLRIGKWRSASTSIPRRGNPTSTEDEVEEILTRPLEDHPGSEGIRVAVGRTDEGHYLRVIYPVFVITAYPLGWKALGALRRRLKRRRR